MASTSYTTRAETFFSATLSLFRYASVRAAGIVLVEQEGDSAGMPKPYKMVLEPALGDLAEQVAAILCRSLETGTQPAFDLPPSELACVPLKGQFETPIGYVWAIPPFPPDLLTTVSDSVLYFVDSSKKSRFHEVFSSTIVSAGGDLGIFDLIARSIQDGLYCDSVIVWEADNSLLRSRNISKLDLPIPKSIAGRSMTGEATIVHDVNTFDIEPYYKTFFKDHELRAAFFLPIRNTNSDNPIGVCGVFYKRPYGTTAIDRLLSEYVIRYYEVLWSMSLSEESARKALNEISDTREFVRDAVRTLVDFHDITSIQVGLAKNIADAMTLMYRVPTATDVLREAEKQVSKLKTLIETNSTSLKVAKSFAELLIDEEDVPIQLVNVFDLVHEEVDAIGRTVKEDYRGALDVRYEAPQHTYRIRKADLVRVLRNLVSNSLRAIADRRQGGKSIVVTIFSKEPDQLGIRVRDNGPGIQPGLEEKIFEPLYTTNAAKGGRGLGLAIVRAVARRYGRKPRVASEWGYYAELEVILDHYSGKKRK